MKKAKPAAKGKKKKGGNDPTIKGGKGKKGGNS
jgi:hypothetical protein